MKESAFLSNNESVLEKLKDIRFFKSFSDENLKSFLNFGKIRQFSPKEKIINEGDLDRWIYFLLSGKIAIVKNGKRIATLHNTGEVFGEMGVIDREPRSATIEALSKTLTLGIDGSLLEDTHRKDDVIFAYTIYRLFAEILAERLRATTEENSRLKEQIQAGL